MKCPLWYYWSLMFTNDGQDGCLHEHSHGSKLGCMLQALHPWWHAACSRCETSWSQVGWLYAYITIQLGCSAWGSIRFNVPLFIDTHVAAHCHNKSGPCVGCTDNLWKHKSLEMCWVCLTGCLWADTQVKFIGGVGREEVSDIWHLHTACKTHTHKWLCSHGWVKWWCGWVSQAPDPSTRTWGPGSTDNKDLDLSGVLFIDTTSYKHKSCSNSMVHDSLISSQVLNLHGVKAEAIWGETPVQK